MRRYAIRQVRLLRLVRVSSQLQNATDTRRCRITPLTAVLETWVIRVLPLSYRPNRSL